MTETCCRACDGRKARKVVDKDNVFSSKTVTCSACGGTGRNPGPPKGDGSRRSFRRAPKSEDDDNDLNTAGDAFLRRHGYGKNGR